jgi:hypothetical protein
MAVGAAMEMGTVTEMEMGTVTEMVMGPVTEADRYLAV